MSLSKYFKNSPSFKPENLVKPDETDSSAWAPEPRNKDRPFQSQRLLPPAGSPHDLALTGSSSFPQRFHENQEDDGNDLFAPPPHTLELPLDLSKYITVEAAEIKIAEAYHQGEEDGREQSEQDFGAAAQALFLACQQLDTLRETIIANSRQEVLDFTLAIAERILRLSVREQDHTIVATIDEALRRAVKSDEFTIHIHPDDYDTIVRKSGEIIAGISGLNNIVVRKDMSIERGGASIESDNCTIDATIASQFDEIREALKGRT
jgi:flagellar assembly protein FliH